MNMPQDVNFSAPRIFLFITRAEDEKKLDGILDWLNVPICYQCRGQGTAPSELLDIFGLGGTTRVLTAGILPKFVIKVLFEKVDEQFSFRQKGKGIAFTIPVTGLQGTLFQLLKDEVGFSQQVKERNKGDMAEIHEKSKYNVIWVSVNAGYSDDVVDAARSAGAKGGTVLRGRRRNSEQVSQHFGIPMQDEQDFVMIVVPRDKKSDIMSAICSSCGLQTPAHGTVISIPVDEAIGLEE